MLNICKCDCGNIVKVPGTYLKNGNTTSCGCKNKERLIKQNTQDAKIPLGSKYGKLTVIADIGYKEQSPGHRRQWYKCQCDCGNEKEVMGNHLKQNQVKSCGNCNLNSIGEYTIIQLLDQANINYQHDIVFPELFQESQRKLRFDFIIFDEKFEKPIRFIEYDGRQHFQGPDTNCWGRSMDTLQSIQEKDNIKNKFCLSHNYSLVRIPYTIKNITLDDLLGDKYLIKESDFYGD